MASITEIDIPRIQVDDLGNGLWGFTADKLQKEEEKHGVILAEVNPSSNGVWVLHDSARFKPKHLGITDAEDPDEIVAYGGINTYTRNGINEDVGVLSVLVTNNTIQRPDLIPALIECDQVMGYIGMGGGDPLSINGVTRTFTENAASAHHDKPDPFRDIQSGRLIMAVQRYNNRSKHAEVSEKVRLKKRDLTCRECETNYWEDVQEATPHHQGTDGGLVDEDIAFLPTEVAIYPTPPSGIHRTKSFHHLFIPNISRPNVHVIARSVWDNSVAIAVEVDQDGQIITHAKQNHSEKMERNNPINVFNREIWRAHEDKYYSQIARPTVIFAAASVNTAA